jgi:hypothetical protein
LKENWMRHQRDRRRNIVQGLVAGAGAVGILLAGTAATQADFLECLGLMIVDPSAHAATCLPSNVLVDFRSLITLDHGAGVPTPTTTTTSSYTPPPS